MRVTSKKARCLRKGFTLTELASVIAIIIIIIILLTPFIKDIRTKAQIIACEENLEKISLGLTLYASAHQGKFPATLAELSEGGYVESERVFDCSGNSHIGDAMEPDYQYISGQTIASGSEDAIVFDKEGNHKNGKHILYINGDIVWKHR